MSYQREELEKYQKSLAKLRTKHKRKNLIGSQQLTAELAAVSSVGSRHLSDDQEWKKQFYLHIATAYLTGEDGNKVETPMKDLAPDVEPRGGILKKYSHCYIHRDVLYIPSRIHQDMTVYAAHGRVSK